MFRAAHNKRTESVLVYGPDIEASCTTEGQGFFGAAIVRDRQEYEE